LTEHAYADAPDWFLDALSTRRSTATIRVAGADLVMRCWGETGPGVVLVHGGAAHSRWWDHIAPILAADYRVVALDLSGHGDSDWRDRYSLDMWADEVMAVAEAGGVLERPVLVGHSIGGWVAMTAAAKYSGRLLGLITVDSPIRPLDDDENGRSRYLSFGPRHHYRTKHEAALQFRVVPDDPSIAPYLTEHVAANSVTRRGGGWTWKFDPAVFDRPRPELELLDTITCRFAMLRAEFGLVTPEIGARMSERLGDSTPLVTLAGAGHHVVLGDPLALIAGVRTVLSSWLQPAERSSLAPHPHVSGVTERR
jgi:pimeloyl-ACP methyl ester carboxylesterase